MKGLHEATASQKIKNVKHELSNTHDTQRKEGLEHTDSYAGRVQLVKRLLVRRTVSDDA